MKKEAILIYPHQLFEDNPLLKKRSLVFLIEEPLMFTQYAFHKQKLMFHRASMREYEGFLLKRGFVVRYVQSDEIRETGDIADILSNHNIESVRLHDVVDDWLHSRLTKALAKASISCEIADTPLFLTSRCELEDFFTPLLKEGKKFLMRPFYVWQRTRLGVLLEEDGGPTGGKWSYDEDNRKRLPKGVPAPRFPDQNEAESVAEAREYVRARFNGNYGADEGFFYPVTFGQAKAWLDEFLMHKLEAFGPYEDAMTDEESPLFHSVLSPLLNAGLLTPRYVLDRTLRHAREHGVSLPSLEGFVRQIIGWREYVRAVYVYRGREMRSSNYFGAHAAIPESFWKGTTGLAPVDDTIKTTLAHGYAHHIQRLMIMGNIMNLCGFKPDEVYKWFMELYVDAYDWVMVPNVYGMALYADGGKITSKPYVSGSSYVLRMSDYKKGEWSDVWDALFWNFVDAHYDALSGEGRLGFIGLTYQKMSEEKKGMYKKRARDFMAGHCVLGTARERLC